MPFAIAPRRVSYWFLCTVPVLTTGLISVRALRVPPVDTVVGVLVGLAIASALWVLGAHSVRDADRASARTAWTSALFAVPSLLTGALWIGLGIPAEATAAENLMRYEVLLTAAIGITCAFVLLADALADASDPVIARVGLGLSSLAGAAYVVWTSAQVGTFVLTLRDGHRSAAVAELNDVLDALLFAASALTYLATASFAQALRHTGWLAPRPAAAYVVLSLLAVSALCARGVAFPDPLVGPPWYTRIGFVVGIPAVPWVLPFLLGVVLLRRLSDRPDA